MVILVIVSDGDGRGDCRDGGGGEKVIGNRMGSTDSTPCPFLPQCIIDRRL